MEMKGSGNMADHSLGKAVLNGMSDRRNGYSRILASSLGWRYNGIREWINHLPPTIWTRFQ